MTLPRSLSLLFVALFCSIASAQYGGGGAYVVVDDGQNYAQFQDVFTNQSYPPGAQISVATWGFNVRWGDSPEAARTDADAAVNEWIEKAKAKMIELIELTGGSVSGPVVANVVITEDYCVPDMMPGVWRCKTSWTGTFELTMNPAGM